MTLTSHAEEAVLKSILGDAYFSDHDLTEEETLRTWHVSLPVTKVSIEDNQATLTMTSAGIIALVKQLKLAA